MADRGMISADTIKGLEERQLQYILGARMRRQREVRDAVLSRAGSYRVVALSLQVKEVRVEGCRYIVCFNPGEAERDAAEREAIVAGLEDRRWEGAGQLIGNRGYRRFLRVERSLRRQVCAAH